MFLIFERVKYMSCCTIHMIIASHNGTGLKKNRLIRVVLWLYSQPKADSFKPILAILTHRASPRYIEHRAAKGSTVDFVRRERRSFKHNGSRVETDTINSLNPVPWRARASDL